MSFRSFVAKPIRQFSTDVKMIPGKILIIPMVTSISLSHSEYTILYQGGRGHWAVYYTSPQSIMWFFISWVYKFVYLFLNYQN